MIEAWEDISASFDNAEYLAKIGEQNGVPTYDGQIISLPTVHNFDKSNLYSTTEQVVGKWTDGRPLYQRTFTGTIPSSGSSTSDGKTTYEMNIATISNLSHGKLVNGEIRKDNYITILNQPLLDMYHFGVYFENNVVKLSLEANSSSIYYMGGTYYITIQYTKTTDAANSFNYASENDYSTSETIVGTWYDGKTLYQRTLTGNFPSNSTSVNLLTNFTGKVIKWSGYATNVYGGVSAYVALPSANGGTYSTALYVSGSIVTFSIQGNLTNVFYGQPYYVTVQYTKS